VAVIDGCSRQAVGHAMGQHADAALAIGAVELAISRREVNPDQDQGLIYHSASRAVSPPAWRSGSGLRRWASTHRWGRSAIASTTPLIESFCHVGV
jgi:transposase InsO family protein